MFLSIFGHDYNARWLHYAKDNGTEFKSSCKICIVVICDATKLQLPQK
jgi:hypothetical protein